MHDATHMEDTNRMRADVRECHLCDGAMQGDGDYHPACEAEYRRRRANMLCLLCGQGKVCGQELWCDTCLATGNVTPRGYPGGRRAP